MRSGGSPSILRSGGFEKRGGSDLEQQRRECRFEPSDSHPADQPNLKGISGEALVTLNGERRKAMADQIMTASKQRLRDKLGMLSLADIAAVEQGRFFN